MRVEPRCCAPVDPVTMMELMLRPCGRSHCPPGDTFEGCAVRQAQLPSVPSTLLIPLVARAHGARLYPWLDCGDRVAADLLDCLQAPVASFLGDRVAVLNVLWRTRVLKSWAQAFFARHVDAAGWSLGCGLSHHFQWLDTGRNHWIDADLHPVWLLREQLLPETLTRRVNRVIDISSPDWWDRMVEIQGPVSGPVFVVFEGVLMYFQPDQVHRVLQTFAERAPPGSQLVFDAISHVGVGQARHSISVGATGAEFYWGLRDAGELLRLHPRFKMAAMRSVSECYGWLGWATEATWLPWTGSPLYAMVALEV